MCPGNVYTASPAVNRVSSSPYMGGGGGGGGGGEVLGYVSRDCILCRFPCIVNRVSSRNLVYMGGGGRGARAQQNCSL